jgi:hypothetical protein
MKERGKSIPAPLILDDPNPTTKRPTLSKLCTLLSRLSSPMTGTGTGFSFTKSASARSPWSSSFVQAPPLPLPLPLPVSATTTYSQASAAHSRVLPGGFGSSGDTLTEDAAGWSPLTPLDFGSEFEAGFGVWFGSPVRSNLDVHAPPEVSVFEDDDDDHNDHPRDSPTEEQDEDELMGMDPFGIIPRLSMDSVSRLSAPAAASSYYRDTGLGGDIEGVSAVSLDRGLRRRATVSRGGWDLRPLPTPPSPSSPSSGFSDDWTLTLPLLVDGPGGGLLASPKDNEDLECMQCMQAARREDWTLGLDLAWSAGMLMGDERGDGRAREGCFDEPARPVRAEEGELGRRRSGSPYPLLERSHGRPLSHHPAAAAVDEKEHQGGGGGGGDMDPEVYHRDNSAMEQAFQALLNDSGQGRLSQFGRPLSLQMQIDDRKAFRDAYDWGSRVGSECFGPGRLAQDTAERASMASTRTVPYYSARSSWQC